MAGDWIKMRIGLSRDPHVVRIASALCPQTVRRASRRVRDASKSRPDPIRVVGALHFVWSLFDEQSSDGKLRFYTPAMLDEAVSWAGFAQAMIEVGWLEYDGQVLQMHNFGTHNGQSARRRALDADRKRVARASASVQNDVRTPSAECPEERPQTVRNRPQNVRPREEKRREEKDQSQDQKQHGEKSAVLIPEFQPPHPEYTPSEFSDWIAIKNYLRPQVGEAAWNLWLRPMYLVKLMSGTHMLLSLPPVKNVVEAARANQPVLYEALKRRGYEFAGFTPYPSEWEMEHIRHVKKS